MATLLPIRLAPAFNQVGQTAQRYAGAFFNDSAGIPQITPIPKNIGATTVDTSPFNVTGFNTFMAMIDVTVANITFSVNLIDPRDQVTILATRTILLVAFGSGVTFLNWGFGNAAAQAGVDVFVFMSLRFIGAGANATINQFPGLWGCVR